MDEQALKTKPKRTPIQVRLSRTPAQNVQADLVATHRAKGNSTRASTLRRVRRRPKRKQVTA